MNIFIAFRKPMFQSRITIFTLTTKTPFRTVIFNPIDVFDNMSIESISSFGMKNLSENNDVFRIQES